jgi:chorismate mutase/prephenate dehydratase
MSIEENRKKIDQIDDEIIKLLDSRASVVKEIGKYKKEQNIPFFKPEREAEIFDKIEKNDKLLFPRKALKHIYREIMSASRKLEYPIKVAYLGPEATYTHLAALEKFGSSTEAFPVKSIGDVFTEVENDKCDYGVVPIENSYEGVVNHTLDMFTESDVKICSELYLRISHCLLSNCDKISDIKKIYSHPQSFAQCRSYIENTLSKAEKNEVSSNSKAASIVEWDKYSAAIASEAAATIYNLKVLDSDIQDSKNNFTRFLVIGKDTPGPSGNDKTSILCTITDKPGALFSILEPFRYFNANLTKIESRPSRKKAWDYIFFIDIDGHISSENIRNAIEKVREQCLEVKILGSYPKSQIQ